MSTSSQTSLTHTRTATVTRPVLDDGFDPTIPEDGTGVVESSSGNIEALFRDHLPSASEIATVARDSFGDIFSDDLMRDLVNSSNAINESIRRILHEHMGLGFRFVEIVRMVESAYIRQYGNTRDTLARASKDAFGYIQKLHKVSISTIRSHIRSYNKFHDNADAVEFLRQSEMQLLLGRDIGDDVVNSIIEAKKNDPAMSTRAVKDLIGALRQAQDHINASEQQLNSVNEAYGNLLGQHDALKAETRHIVAEQEKLKRQLAADQEAAAQVRVELGFVSQSRSSMQQQIAELDRALAIARNELTEARAKPSAKETPAIREDVQKMEDVYMDLVKKTRELQAQIDAKKREEAEIAARLAEKTAALEASQRLEHEMNALVQDFSGFAQRYHSAQLLCTADGNPARYRSIFLALADVVGKFHAEIVAASKVG